MNYNRTELAVNSVTLSKSLKCSRHGQNTLETSNKQNKFNIEKFLNPVSLTNLGLIALISPQVLSGLTRIAAKMFLGLVGYFGDYDTIAISSFTFYFSFS